MIIAFIWTFPRKFLRMKSQYRKGSRVNNGNANFPFTTKLFFYLRIQRAIGESREGEISPN